jgi:hypothetical protein
MSSRRDGECEWFVRKGACFKTGVFREESALAWHLQLAKSVAAALWGARFHFLDKLPVVWLRATSRAEPSNFLEASWFLTKMLRKVLLSECSDNYFRVVLVRCRGSKDQVWWCVQTFGGALCSDARPSQELHGTSMSEKADFLLGATFYLLVLLGAGKSGQDDGKLSVRAGCRKRLVESTQSWTKSFFCGLWCV